MTLITLLVGIIVFAVIFYALNTLIPDPYRKIGNLIVGVLFLVWLVSGLLGGSDLWNIKIGQ